MASEEAEKVCAVCGRVMTPRRRWADLEAVKYCSAGCRARRKLTKQDRALEEAIEALLAKRARGATICPSEAARRVAGPDADFRPLMEPARRAARRLVARGHIEITQGGRVVEPSSAKGPIRLRKSQSRN